VIDRPGPSTITAPVSASSSSEPASTSVRSPTARRDLEARREVAQDALQHPAIVVSAHDGHVMRPQKGRRDVRIAGPVTSRRRARRGRDPPRRGAPARVRAGGRTHETSPMTPIWLGSSMEDTSAWRLAGMKHWHQPPMFQGQEWRSPGPTRGGTRRAGACATGYAVTGTVPGALFWAAVVAGRSAPSARTMKPMPLRSSATPTTMPKTDSLSAM
jgi:hypothetical protein